MKKKYSVTSDFDRFGRSAACGLVVYNAVNNQRVVIAAVQADDRSGIWISVETSPRTLVSFVELMDPETGRRRQAAYRFKWSEGNPVPEKVRRYRHAIRYCVRKVRGFVDGRPAIEKGRLVTTEDGRLFTPACLQPA